MLPTTFTNLKEKQKALQSWVQETSSGIVTSHSWWGCDMSNINDSRVLIRILINESAAFNSVSKAHETAVVCCIEIPWQIHGCLAYFTYMKTIEINQQNVGKCTSRPVYRSYGPTMAGWWVAQLRDPKQQMINDDKNPMYM